MGVGCGNDKHKETPLKTESSLCQNDDSIKLDMIEDTETTSNGYTDSLYNEDYHRGPFNYIRHNWKPQKVKPTSKSGKPTVADFFNVYYSYFKNKSDFKYQFQMIQVDNDKAYEMDIDIKNGFLRKYDPFDAWQCCIWNRNNGHVLIAIDWSHECDGWGSALCFFDYNPQTKLMSMEEALTDKFRQISTKGKEGLSDDYSDFAELPHKGKDIHLMSLNLSFKWNGYDFDFPK